VNPPDPSPGPRAADAEPAHVVVGAWSAIAVEIALPGGAVVRGQRWGADPAILLLHAPGSDRDLDDWGDLPAALAAAVGAGVLALDSPGHGLSDDGDLGNDPAVLVSAICATPAGHAIRAVVAAGETAGALLAAGPVFPLAGLVCVSPASDRLANPNALPRSPRLPKLLLVRSGADNQELEHARSVSRAVGGWAVVVGISANGPGTALLEGASAAAVRDHVAGFLRECLARNRTVHA
jgi:pimeloyl-ACP methyl ester carboxylesterase